MVSNSLGYKLLYPEMPVDGPTEILIKISYNRIKENMIFFSQQGEHRIIIDNNELSIRTYTLKTRRKELYEKFDLPSFITAAGCILGENGLHLFSPRQSSSRFPLPKPLEEMTKEEVQSWDKNKFIAPYDPSLFVKLWDYAVE